MSYDVIMHQTRGEYGTDITKEARPLPLEYLIIEVTSSSPLKPHPLLPGGNEPFFPVENREALGLTVQVTNNDDVMIM